MMRSADQTGAEWFKSSWSNTDGECVEVAVLPGTRVAVRDTKDHGDGPAILFGTAAWSGFVGSLARPSSHGG